MWPEEGGEVHCWLHELSACCSPGRLADGRETRGVLHALGSCPSPQGRLAGGREERARAGLPQGAPEADGSGTRRGTGREPVPPGKGL